MGTYIQRLSIGVQDNETKDVWSPSTRGVGYETADYWIDDSPTSRLIVYEFTVDKMCSKIYYTNLLYKHV